jgi:hypothetical protein
VVPFGIPEILATLVAESVKGVAESEDSMKILVLCRKHPILSLVYSKAFLSGLSYLPQKAYHRMQRRGYFGYRQGRLEKTEQTD